MIKKLLFGFLLGSLFFIKDIGAVTINSGESAAVTVSAFVGEYTFSLFGYSSPAAAVTLEGMGILDQTVADSRGYFEFKNRFSPFSSREACLTAKDQLGRITAPACLPPFPIKYNVVIGPVIIPPTISLDAGSYWQGDEIRLSGQTIPNSKVNFSTFVNEKKSLFDYLVFEPIKPVEAFTFPKLETVADSKGNFSLALPSSSSRFFRIFAQTNYLDDPSPKSIILNLKVLPIWMVIVLRLLEIIIILQLLALAIFFLRRYIHPQAIAKNRALAVRGSLLPDKEQEHTLMLLREHKRSV